MGCVSRGGREVIAKAAERIAINHAQNRYRSEGLRFQKIVL